MAIASRVNRGLRCKGAVERHLLISSALDHEVSVSLMSKPDARCNVAGAGCTDQILYKIP